MTTSGVVVTGIGVLSAAGGRLSELASALERGDSVVSRIQRYEPGDGEPRQAAELRDFVPESVLGEGNYRPLDRLGRLAAAGARRALVDAFGPWESQGERTADVGLVLGSYHGGLETIVAFDRRGQEAGPLYVRPFDFANTVLNAAAGQAAIQNRLRGPNATIAGGVVAGHQAIALAADRVRAGRASVLLGGGAEALSRDAGAAFVAAGWAATGDLSGGEATPFDARRQGFVPAEGAAFLVLEREEDLAGGRRVRGRILGHASGFDPSRGTDLDRASGVLARTIGNALEDAGLGLEAVDLVCSSASGVPWVERVESAALGDLAGGRRFPTMAPKAVLGEGGGASGPWQVLSTLASLEMGRIPGVAGRSVPDETLDPALDVRQEARVFSGKVGLVLGLGLDGPMVALVVARV